MVSRINEAFMQFDRRAEANDPSKLVATFVNVGALATLISARDHQIIFGRRGTGKTHALHFLNEDRQKNGDVSIYIDLRTIGSSTGIYTDPGRTLPERSTVLLRDVLMAIHDGLLDFALKNAESANLAELGPILDELASAVSGTQVVGTIAVKAESAQLKRVDEKAEFRANLTTAPSLNVGTTDATVDETSRKQAVEYKVQQRASVVFGAIDNSLRRFAEAVKQRTWILLDEWSTIPLELQPYLADLVRRALLPVSGLTVKIAAIEHRTGFRLEVDHGGYVGIEVGADVSADINLDDFMVFENSPTRATAFFADLVFRHYVALVSNSEAPPSADALMGNAFTQRNAFDELVKAAEGVPRDAINILNLAAQKALDDRITINHVRTAARDWYLRDKSRALTERAQLESLLNWIRDEVIGKRQARAFLVPATTSDSRIEELFDARVLHILKKNVSSNEQPGIRYRVYKIDYGCYVDLINTARAPLRLFAAMDGEGHEIDVEVPDDDYRSIRRAILDLTAYEASIATSEQ